MGGRQSKKLQTQRASTIRKLPPLDRVLRGSLLKRYRKCGKPSCHCMNGKPHGPNYYLTVKQRDGSTVTVPIHPELVATVRKYIKNYASAKKVLEEICSINIKLIRRGELDS